MAEGFEVTRSGERSEGLARGIDPAHLGRLRRGERPIERRELTAELRAAFTEGVRCVLVVHGRGLHSEAGPVLRDGLVDWLIAAPLASWVMAFATAQPRHGGPGASYVLLRRARRD